jgi:hypothetical protein
MDKIDLQSVLEQALKDPSLFSTLDIENLLQSVENVKNDYLENKTMTQINTSIYAVLCQLYLDKQEIQTICEKLLGYRYVENVSEIHKGKHIRWIRLYNSTNVHKLTAGGIVTNVKFLDNGTHIVSMGTGNRFMQYKFDDCLTFQKLTMEEQLILMAYEYAH